MYGQITSTGQQDAQHLAVLHAIQRDMQSMATRLSSLEGSTEISDCTQAGQGNTHTSANSGALSAGVGPEVNLMGADEERDDDDDIPLRQLSCKARRRQQSPIRGTDPSAGNVANPRIPSDLGQRRVNVGVPSDPAVHVHSMAGGGIPSESRSGGENLMAGGILSDSRQDISYNGVPSDPREHGFGNRVPSDPRETRWARAGDTPLDGPLAPVQVPERANMDTTANDIREDRDVMADVARRLLELGMQEAEPGVHHEAIDRIRRRGKKSGQARTNEDFVVREVEWPHFHVFKGSDRKATRFEDMNLADFVYGFLTMLESPRSRFSTPVMLEILKGVVSDAMDFPWQNVRNCYRIISSQVEMGLIDWVDREQIYRLRQRYAHRSTAPPVNVAAGRTVGDKKPCFAFQKGECSQARDHGMFYHYCAYCAKVTGYMYSHSEANCMRKQKGSKNEKQGESHPSPRN